MLYINVNTIIIKYNCFDLVTAGHGVEGFTVCLCLLHIDGFVVIVNVSYNDPLNQHTNKQHPFDMFCMDSVQGWLLCYSLIELLLFLLSSLDYNVSSNVHFRNLFINDYAIHQMSRNDRLGSVHLYPCVLACCNGVSCRMILYYTWLLLLLYYIIITVNVIFVAIHLVLDYSNNTK